MFQALQIYAIGFQIISKIKAPVVQKMDNFLSAG